MIFSWNDFSKLGCKVSSSFMGSTVVPPQPTQMTARATVDATAMRIRRLRVNALSGKRAAPREYSNRPDATPSARRDHLVYKFGWAGIQAPPFHRPPGLCRV